VRIGILEGIGVQFGVDRAIQFHAGDHQLLTLAFAQAVFGSGVTDDLFIVPDHGSQMLQVDHHDVVHVDFADPARVPSFVEHMRQEKYQLPTALPDSTFKPPDWMQNP
jgi:hypothetical protein